MKHLAIITFDIVREDEPEVAFSVASILSYLKGQPGYGQDYEVHHKSVNLSNSPLRTINWIDLGIDWHAMDFIAVSCYIWSHKQSLGLMRWLKDENVQASIIAGGYQVNVNDLTTLTRLYPDADHFILGYAERALYQIIQTGNAPAILQVGVDFSQIPSPFITEVISLSNNTSRIRLETKRGCPYECTFCAQHDLDQRKVYYYLETRLLPELEHIHKFSPTRISVTDPVFNMGNTYIPYLEQVNSLGMKGVFNFQVRPELISRKNDERFLDLIAETESEIELGIQTFDPAVNAVIKRRNNYPAIQKTLDALRDREIKFGISLIYGLPNQTLKSFENDVDQVSRLGIKNVVAYPLMFLPGTEMQKHHAGPEYGEEVLGEYAIPHVSYSPSFSNAEWQEMHLLAGSLNPSGRLF